jgi:hypothetical protein
MGEFPECSLTSGDWEQLHKKLATAAICKLEICGRRYRVPLESICGERVSNVYQYARRLKWERV